MKPLFRHVDNSDLISATFHSRRNSHVIKITNGRRQQDKDSDLKERKHWPRNLCIYSARPWVRQQDYFYSWAYTYMLYALPPSEK